jgi:hypothetical protein
LFLANPLHFPAFLIAYAQFVSIICKRSFLNNSRVRLIDDTAEFDAQILEVAVGDRIFLRIPTM